jgi:hypothetical protein
MVDNRIDRFGDRDKLYRPEYDSYYVAEYFERSGYDQKRLCHYPECFYDGICTWSIDFRKTFDKVGTRIGYTIAIVIWGFSFMHSMARGILSFSFFRVTQGLGEAGNWPGAVKSNAEWFPVKERAIAQEF